MAVPVNAKRPHCHQQSEGIVVQFIPLTSCDDDSVSHFAVDKITRIHGGTPTTVYLGPEAFNVKETFEQIELLARAGLVTGERLAAKDRATQMATGGSMMR